MGDDDFKHTSMYRSLHTNLPMQIMAYSDFPYPANNSTSFAPSFVHHSEVLKYLEGYAEHFHLRPLINLHSKVVSIAPHKDDVQTEKNQVSGTASIKWELDSIQQTNHLNAEEKEQKQYQRRREVFDAVFICTGHFTHPRLPREAIEGFDQYQGLIMHSHDYRVPDPFTDKTVAIVGAGASAVDIARVNLFSIL